GGGSGARGGGGPPRGSGGRRGGGLGGSDAPRSRFVTVFKARVRPPPVSVETRRYARVLLNAERPADGTARSVHRFRRATEPWALDALAFAGAPELAATVEAARALDFDEPLVRGDELGLPPGPEVGRILEQTAEERAVGTITTREEALELARRETAR